VEKAYESDHRSLVREPAEETLHNEGKDATSHTEVVEVAHRSASAFVTTGGRRSTSD
jgi:hypothetical protein